MKTRILVLFLIAIGACAKATSTTPEATAPTPEATSTFTVQTAGTVGSPSATAVVSNTATLETVACSGPVKVVSNAVTDPALPPGVVVSIDASGLSCVGQTTKTIYLNTGYANLTRPLVANDVIKTSFAFYPNGPGGFAKARTALLTLKLGYNTTSGALTSATALVGNL
jgi:hypothetical protein